MPKPLTQKQIDTFQRDGFLVVPGALSADEVESFGTAVDYAVKQRSRGDHRSVEEKTIYEQSFIQCMNLWEDHPDVRVATFNRGLAEMAALLLDTPGIRVWHDQALYKEPGGRETDAHQDLPFWPIRPAHQVTAWIPFQGVTQEMGAMAYLPGSHRVGLKKFVDITHLMHPEPYPILEDPAVAAIEPVWVECMPGDVVFHHSLTVHLASPNTTDQMRRVFCIIYFADGCVRAAPWPHVSVDRQNVGVGEIVQGEVTPLAWPRAEGDIPETPSDFGPAVGFAYSRKEE
ncbi:MAG: hypothetical protein CL917_14700 [Deltaproteobacteria bacterium]|nr:hypothetical protein [Deltaproteobacteria bacterium]